MADGVLTDGSVRVEQIRLPGFVVADVERVVEFLYTGGTNWLRDLKEWSAVVELWRLSHYLQIDSLEGAVVGRLSELLAPETAVPAIKLAERFGGGDKDPKSPAGVLHAAAMKYISANGTAVALACIPLVPVPDVAPLSRYQPRTPEVRPAPAPAPEPASSSALASTPPVRRSSRPPPARRRKDCLALGLLCRAWRPFSAAANATAAACSRRRSTSRLLPLSVLPSYCRVTPNANTVKFQCAVLHTDRC
jgi:hypothetical protein